MEKTNLRLKLKNSLFVPAFYALKPGLFFKRIKAQAGAKKYSWPSTQEVKSKTSVIILTFNALPYIKLCLRSLKNYTSENLEIVVVDNGSQAEVKQFLKEKSDLGVIDKLHLSAENNYFAHGNNIGSALASKDSDYLLLLNSDTEIKHPQWLSSLLHLAKDYDIISFGFAAIPIMRPDGWCFLIKKSLYQSLGGINEYYKMNWGITDLTHRALKAGAKAAAVLNPKKLIKHYGQKSYVNNTLQEKFNRLTNEQVIEMFRPYKISLLKIDY